MSGACADGGSNAPERTTSSSASPPSFAVGRSQREQLVEDDAERVDVAAPIDLLAARLLGRHVAELALEDARLLAEEVRAGDAEVGDLHDALVREQDVLRRDVAVHDVERHAALVLALVRVVQALRGLGDDERRDARRDLRALAACAAAHELAEVEALDVLHREEQALVAVVRELVDLDDVRVVEARRELRLVDEHRAEAPRRAVRRQDALDDEELVRALGAALLGEEHLGHAARAEAAQDLEVGELVGVHGHGRALRKTEGSGAW